MNAVQNPTQQKNIWFWFRYIVLLIWSFTFLIKYLYKEKQVTSAAAVAHTVGQREHQTNVFYYGLQVESRIGQCHRH